MLVVQTRSVREYHAFHITHRDAVGSNDKIRMHSSRMRTARLLLMHCSEGGVPGRGGTCPGGCTWSQGGTCPGGVPAQGGVPGLGGVPTQGVYLLGGVPAGGVPGRGGTCLGGAWSGRVPAWGVYLVWGCTCPGRCTCLGGVPAQVLPPVDRILDTCF